MSFFFVNINEYVSVGYSIVAIINVETRHLCKISNIIDANCIRCIKYDLRTNFIVPISNNIYDNYNAELMDINTNTNNKLYNIKEIVLANYNTITIHSSHILDTVIVATSDQLLNDNGILYNVGIISIFLIRFQQEQPNSPLVSYNIDCQLYDNTIMSIRSIKRSSTLLWYNTMLRLRKSIQAELNKRHSGRDTISSKKVFLSGLDFKRLYTLFCNIQGNEIMLLNTIEDNEYNNMVGINVFNRMYNIVVKYFTGFSFINFKYQHEVISFDIPYTVKYTRI